MHFASIKEAIEDYRAGKFLIVVDDEDRENEGDLVTAAEFATPDTINFMARFGRGLVCMPMLGKRLDELDIPLMVEQSGAPLGTAFTVSVDVKTTTGISAADRAATVQALIDPKTRPEHLIRPGHLFPLRYADGGVLRRAGHTEASVDLAKLAGLYPAAVICEIMNDDGTMARVPDLQRFAARHQINILTIAQLIAYRRRSERLVKRVAEQDAHTDEGQFRVIAYESLVDNEAHLALVKGNLLVGPPPLVRMHSECLTGDVFGSMRCDCGEQLRQAMEMIEQEERGVVVYLRRHEGRGIGLVNKLKAYQLQDKGMDTVEANLHLGFPADPRDYGIGAQILLDLGLDKMRLLTNNPQKRAGLRGFGLEVVDQVPLVVPPNPVNLSYLRTKQAKLGHLLGLAVDERERDGAAITETKRVPKR